MKLIKAVLLTGVALTATMGANAKDVKIEKSLRQCLKQARSSGSEANCLEQAVDSYERKILRSPALYRKWGDRVENRCGQDAVNDSNVARGWFAQCRLDVARNIVKK